MKSHLLVWLLVVVGLVLVLSAIGIRGWVAGAVVALALVLDILDIPLSVKRDRQERNLVRTLWHALRQRPS